MAATSSALELKDTLAQYEAQYDQVNDINTHFNVAPFKVVAALTNDPENDELLKLKADLTVIPFYLLMYIS